MRILFLIRDLGRGGAQSQLSALARGLEHRGHEIRVVAWIRGDKDIGLYDQGTLSVRYIEPRRRRSFLALVEAVRKEMVDFRPDVVHGYMPVENLVLSVAGLIGCRRLPTVWGVRAAPVNFAGYRLDMWLVMLAQRLLSWMPDLVIANSARGAGCVPIAKWRGRFVAIPNGIDIARFSTQNMEKYRRDAQGSLQSDVPLVIVVGRLDPFKGVEYFLDALILLRQRGVSLAVEIIGDGNINYKNELFRRAVSAGLGQVVSWKPAIADIETAYARAQVLVSPSLTEGFSNVLGEAMACGLGVVATKVGEAEQTVGELGWLVPPADAHALADAMFQALEDRNADAQRNRFARISECFSVNALVQNTERHLLELLERH